jgi:hypothetical protein
MLLGFLSDRAAREEGERRNMACGSGIVLDFCRFLRYYSAVKGGWVMKKIQVCLICLLTALAVVFPATISADSQTAQTVDQTKKQPPPTAKVVDPKLAMASRKVIGSSNFEKLASSTFSGAYFVVNTCGGTDAARKSKIFVSGVYQKEESLARLDIQLPPDVLQATMHEAISYSDNPPVIRDARLRACVDNTRTYQWKGTVEGGRFKISMQFNSNVFIKTRIMEEEKKSGGWKDHYDWNDPLADNNIPDYIYVAPCLDIYLSPVLQDGMVSYAQVDVKWSWFKDEGFFWPENAIVSEPFRQPYGHPLEKARVLEYKQTVMNALAGRMSNAFNDPSVRKHLAGALTNSVKTGDMASREIIEVSGKGSSVSVQFKLSP